MIIGAVSGVAVGQQCARHPVPWPTAIHKVVTAALLAATFLAIVGKLAGGQLGNFGRLGIDQGTFGPGVFFWFLVIGLLTVFMLGGATRLPARTRRDPERSGTRTRARDGSGTRTRAGSGTRTRARDGSGART
ncbi:hypothetical protein S7W_09839 [Mycobacteroides abscessus M94]|nr:hypothetical protein S7W_09839 [Mycobacteroides abscessus M94]